VTKPSQTRLKNPRTVGSRSSRRRKRGKSGAVTKIRGRPGLIRNKRRIPADVLCRAAYLRIRDNRHLRPSCCNVSCLDRSSVPARDGQQGTRIVAQDEVKVDDMHAGGEQTWESTAEGFGKRACPCCVPIDLPKCEIRRAWLPPDQQPEAVAESEPITVASRRSTPGLCGRICLRHKQAPNETLLQTWQGTGPSSSVRTGRSAVPVDLSPDQALLYRLC
jgi:hypothetical protein